MAWNSRSPKATFGIRREGQNDDHDIALAQNVVELRGRVDDVGRRLHGFQPRFIRIALNAGLRDFGWNYNRPPCADDTHAEGAGQMGHPVSDLSPTDDPHRLSTQLPELEVALVVDPLKSVLSSNKGRELSRQRQEQTHAVLGHRHGVHALRSGDCDVAPPDRQPPNVIGTGAGQLDPA